MFIEVHDNSSDNLVLLNVEQISSVTTVRNKQGDSFTRFYMSGHIQGDVKESYEELQAMIAETGCIRAKAPDPRLDTRVLTMEDMTKVSMIGEPVWNSSTKKWMLLIDSANDGTWVELINNAGGHEKMNAHDIQNNRFYRTVQKEGD